MCMDLETMSSPPKRKADRFAAALGASIDQGAANNDVLHAILAELKQSNVLHQRAANLAWWTASCAQILLGAGCALFALAMIFILAS